MNNTIAVGRIKNTLILVRDTNGYAQNPTEIIEAIFTEERIYRSSIWSEVLTMLKILISNEDREEVFQLIQPIQTGLWGCGDHKVAAIDRFLELLDMTKACEAGSPFNNLARALYQLLVELKKLFLPKERAPKKEFVAKPKKPKPQKVQAEKLNKVFKEDKTPDEPLVKVVKGVKKKVAKQQKVKPEEAKLPKPEQRADQRPPIKEPTSEDMLLDDPEEDLEDIFEDESPAERMARGKRKGNNEARQRIEQLKEIKEMGFTIEEAREAGLL